MLTKIMSNRLFHVYFYFIFFIVAILSSRSYAGTNSLELDIDNKIELIAIDPGFGGNDFGAPGCKEGIYAKQLNLEIANKLAKQIRDKLHLDIVMTRTEDQFVPLDQRTSIANMERADLFISVHCNAHEDPRVHGIEIYFLDIAADEGSLEVAAIENATSQKNIKDLQKTISDLMLNTKLHESRFLAEQVQDSLYNHMRSKYTDIKNRGIKRAPFYVLIGTEMPAILINVSFISNTRECERLMTEEYQTDLAEGISNGIENFIMNRRNKSSN